MIKDTEQLMSYTVTLSSSLDCATSQKVLIMIRKHIIYTTLCEVSVIVYMLYNMRFNNVCYAHSCVRSHLTEPDTIIFCMGAESSINVNPTNALSSDPKYASRTSGDTIGNRYMSR